ncbi:MAG: MMPL family transporter [Desulfobacterales bacterium]|nr:MMPL family transporter [Desulfobacterales bacterium]
MLRRFLKYLTFEYMPEYLEKWPKTVILVIVALTCLFAYQIPKLSFSTSVYDLVIEDLPETARYKAFKKVFGSDEIIRVVVRSENVFDPLVFRQLELLAETTAKIKGVRRVISLPGIKKAIDISGAWSLDEFAGVLDPVELFGRNIVSEDRKATALTLILSDGADYLAVIGEVDRIIAATPKSLSLYQIGMPLVSQALEEYTRKDFFRLPPLTFLLIGILLICIFRNMAYLILPLGCVSFSLIWTFGLMAGSGTPLSMLTMIVPVFLIAVGTAYCLHIVSAYNTCRRDDQAAVVSVRLAFSEIAFPTVLAVSTTVIGLGSLLLNQIPAIREFALFSCFGMFSLLIMVLTLFPAALICLPPSRGASCQPTLEEGFIDRIITFIVDLNLNRQRLVLPIIAVVVVICIAGIFRLRVETNPVGYFKADTPVSRHFHDIYKDLSGSFPINISMTGKSEEYFQDPVHIAEIAKLQQFVQTLPGVDKSIAYTDYMKLVNYASNQFKPENYVLPEAAWEVRMLANKYTMMLGEDMFTRFMSPDYTSANILLLTHISSSQDFLDLRDKILAYAAENLSKDYAWDVTGFGIVISASSHLLTSGQLKSLSLTMVIVFSILFLLFLSIKVGLVAIVPNLFPIIINFGIMGWFGIELSMFTSLIASIAIGLAVDDTIHYMVRYNKEFKKDLDEKKALQETLRHIGRPIIFTTVTISIGFSILAFSSFQPTAVFGIMMMITMLSALVGDLILLPSLMLHVELVTLWDLVRIKMGTEPRVGIPLFKGLSRTQVHYIVMAGSLKKMEKGAVLFRKGETSDSMYALIAGEMIVVDRSMDPSSSKTRSISKILTRVKTGGLIGEMGLVRGAPRSATVIASSPCELLQVNLKMIKRLQWLYPPMAVTFNFNLMSILCDKLEMTSRSLTDNSFVDDVTGLWNRKTFMENLDTEVYRSKRYASGLTLCLLQLNGQGGEKSGSGNNLTEKNLRSVSAILTQRLRKSDGLGRLDDDIFAFMLPQTKVEEARVIVARAFKSFQDTLTASEVGHFAMALGLAAYRQQSDESGDEFYARAEESLRSFTAADQSVLTSPKSN